MKRALFTLVVCACGGVALPGDAERGPDGSLRREFLGGHFVTWNREFPVELEQVLAGAEPDHPVVVLAGE